MEGMEEALPREIPKPWGSELWFAHTDTYAGKILRVRAGCRLSIQYHEHKDETSYVLSGRVIVSQGASVERMSHSGARAGGVMAQPATARPHAGSRRRLRDHRGLDAAG